MRLGDDWWDDGGGAPVDTPDLPPSTWADNPWPDPSGPPDMPDIPDAPPETVDTYQPTLPNVRDIESPVYAVPSIADAIVAGAGGSGGRASVDDVLATLYQQSGGSTLAADGLAMRLRAQDVGGNDDVLRDAQHALVTQQAIEEYGLPTAAVMAVVAVPAYSLAKLVAQNVPGAATLLQPFSNDPLTREGGATAPSWSEIYWGLRPLWMPLK
jgi:hypothetical protein